MPMGSLVYNLINLWHDNAGAEFTVYQMNVFIHFSFDQLRNIVDYLVGTNNLMESFKTSLDIGISLLGPSNSLISLYEYLLTVFNLADNCLGHMVTLMNFLENYIRAGGDFLDYENVRTFHDLDHNLQQYILNLRNLTQFIRIIETALFQRGLINSRLPMFKCEGIDFHLV